MSEDSIQKSLSKQASYMPKEQLLEVAKKDKHLFIGIPTEISFQENRVALTPEGVSVLVNNGHDIRIERGAGLAAGFEDHQYSDAGAEIVDDPELIYQAQIVLKVEPPSLEEIAMMSERQILISALQLTIQPEDFLKKLIGKKNYSRCMGLSPG